MPDLTPLEAAEKLEKEAGFVERFYRYYGADGLDDGYISALRFAASYLHKIANGEYKQVVECGECEYWQNDGVHLYGICKNPNIGNVKLDTDYCSYGARKEETHE
nr:MAG TPA: hypothetical protein [Caudoviricetes sp.]